MFERLLASILTRLLGEYVEDATFSKESVKLGIWRGYLVLENMHIKKGLVDTLELPLALRHGMIGRLEIQIPWSNLGKHPIVIAIDRLFLVVEPKLQWDADALKRREQAIKRAKIATAELFRASPLDSVQNFSSEGASKARWGSGLQKWVTDRLITRIVDSLQIHVREVHIRYEDHLSYRGAPFFAGATIESVHVESKGSTAGVEARAATASPGGVFPSSAPASMGARVGVGESAAGASAANATTTEGDGPGSGRDRRRLVEKELRLSQLALYWNPEEAGNPCSMHLTDIPAHQADSVLSRLIPRKDVDVEASTALVSETRSRELRHRYLLEPLDATAQMALSIDPMDRSQPRCQVQAKVGTILGHLQDFQLQGAMCLSASLAQHAEIGKYFKHRPIVPVRVDPTAWWRYAIVVVLEKMRAATGRSERLPDMGRRRQLRLEYILLWKISRGWSSMLRHGDEGDPDLDPTGLRPTEAPAPAGNEPSFSDVLASPPVTFFSSTQVDTEDNASAESTADPASSVGTRRRSAAHRKSGRISAQETLAVQARLKELEEELTFEDIIIFRAMAEREEARRVERGSIRRGNRWGIGGWVSWAIGSGSEPTAAEEDPGDDGTDDNFERLFAAIDFDPSRAPTAAPKRGEAAGPLDWGGWLAASLELSAAEGRLDLTRSVGAKQKYRELPAGRPEATAFMGIGFSGFRLRAELHGEDMDGVLAWVTLNDLDVHEFRDQNGASEGGRGAARSSSQAGEATIESIIFRRGDSASRRGLHARRASQRLLAEAVAGGLSSRPLFAARFEMNPRDAEYDAKVLLDVDQMEAVVSPTAAWVEDIMAFVQIPEELENRATLELAASNQLRNLKTQLESKLEMVMSDRLQLYADLNVEAPLVVIPVDVERTGMSAAGDEHGTAASGIARESERMQEPRLWRTERPGVVGTTELLLLNLGSIRISTSKLAHLQRDAESSRGEKGSNAKADSFVASISPRSSPRQPRADSDSPGSLQGRRGRMWSNAGSVGEALSSGRTWHANFYDVYNIDVCRVGVRLARMQCGGLNREALTGRTHRQADVEGRKSPSFEAISTGDAGSGRWLVAPFDVKVEAHLSVLPSDPNISQLKFYGDVPAVHVRLSESKLQRIAKMSTAIAAQSAALEASRSASGSSTVPIPPAETGGDFGPSDSGGDSVAGGRSSLSSFLEFQRMLSQRFDDLHRDTRQPSRSPKRNWSGDLRRERLSGQRLSAESGRESDVEDFASAWGGSSSGDTDRLGGGSGSTPSPKSSRSLRYRSLSAESDFYDARDGPSSVGTSQAPSPSRGGVAEAVTVESEAGEATRVGQAGVGVGVTDATTSDEERATPVGPADVPSEEDEEMFFHDTHDPVAEMDEALTAKEAEKADLMKRRQRLHEQMNRSDLSDAELKRIREASSEVSAKLNACEDEVKDLSSALEDLTEAFERAATQVRRGLSRDDLRQIPGGGTRNAFRDSEAGASDISLPSVPTQEVAKDPLGMVVPHPQIGPNREVIMCGLTFPLIRVDILKDRQHLVSLQSESTRGHRTPRRPNETPQDRQEGGWTDEAGVDEAQASWDGDVDGTQADAREKLEDDSEEQEIASMRLVGLGLQLHSKSYNARLSFSMQDLQIKDCLQTWRNAQASLSAAPLGKRGAGKRSRGSQAEPGDSRSRPCSPSSPKAVGTGQRPGVDIVTSRPRLFLWRRADVPPRRVVSFRDGLEEGASEEPVRPVDDAGPRRVGRRGNGTPPAGEKRQPMWKPPAGTEDNVGFVGRPDVIQLSYAMKKGPARGGAEGARGSEMESQDTRETHRVKLLVGALEVALEQDTLLTILQIASAAMMQPTAPLETGGFGPTASSSLLSETRSGEDPSVGDHAAVDPNAIHAALGTVMVPKLPPGVAATIVVDVAALSVALTDGGQNLAALTGDSARFEATARLANLSVLDLTPPGECRSPTNLSPIWPAAGHGTRGGGPDIPSSPIGPGVGRAATVFADPTLDRGQGGIGPLLDVVLSMEAIEETVGRYGSDDAIGAKRGARARIKIKLDKMRAVASIPFCETLARYFLTGPLMDYLLAEAGDDQPFDSRVSGGALAPPPLGRPEPTDGATVRSGAACLPDERSQGGSADFDAQREEGDLRRRRLSGQVLAPPSRGPDQGRQILEQGADSMWPLVSFEVGLEVSDISLEIPLELRGDRRGRVECITSKLGHLLVDTAWALPAESSTRSSSDGGETSLGPCPGMLDFEMILACASIGASPEGFDILEAVHVRTVATIPFSPDAVLAASEGYRTGPAFPAAEDQLGDKLRQRVDGDSSASLLLPRRPSLEDRSRADGMHSTERAQLRLAISPVRLNLAEAHLLPAACFATDAATQLAVISSMGSPPPQVAMRSRTSSSSDDEDGCAPMDPTPSFTHARKQLQVPLLAPAFRERQAEARMPGTRQAAQRWRDSGRVTRHDSEGVCSPRDGHALLPGASVGAVAPPAGEGPKWSPFLGSFSVDSFCVTLLTETTEGASAGDRGNVPENSTGSSDGEAPYRPQASARPQLHDPLMLLEVCGIGSWVDISGVPRSESGDSSSQSVAASLGAEGGRGGSRLRARLAIESATLTDMSDRRRGELVRVFGPCAPGDQGSAGVQGNSDSRPHAAGWPGAPVGSKDVSRRTEQIVCDALVCTESKILSLDARLASGRLMVIPAPLSQALGVLSGLYLGVTAYARSGVAATEDDPHVRTGRSPRIGVAERVELDALCATEDTIGTRAAERHSGGTFPRAPLLLSEAAEGSAHGVDNAELDVVRGRSWREAVRDLGGPVLADFLWLEQADLSLSAGEMQLWIPDASGASLSARAAAQAKDPRTQAVQGGLSAEVTQSKPHAIVASCEYCHAQTSLRVSQLRVDGRSGGAAAAIAAARTRKISSRESQPTASRERKANGVGDVDSASSVEDADETSSSASHGDSDAESGDSLLALTAGARALQVFVAQPSLADFGAHVDPRGVLPVKFSESDAEKSEGMDSRAERGSCGEADAVRSGPEPVDDLKTEHLPTLHLGSRVLGSAVANEAQLASMKTDTITPGGDWGVGTGDTTNARGREDTTEHADGNEGNGNKDGGLAPGLMRMESIVRPLNAELSHVVRPRAGVSSASPLVSEMDIRVSSVHVVGFLEFPLLDRIMVHSVEPLQEAVAAFYEQTNSGCTQTDRHTLEEARMADRAVATRRGGVSGESPSRTGSIAHVEMWPSTAVYASPPGDTPAFELLGMWTLKAQLQAEGFQATVMNNMSRVARPAIKVNIYFMQGQLDVFGAGGTGQAVISTRLSSSFYNTRLMAWEPLLEPWNAEFALGARQGCDATYGAGRHTQTAHRPTRPGHAHALSGNRQNREGHAEGVHVDMRLASKEVLDVNLTESLAESLAAVVQPSQGTIGNRDALRAGGINLDGSFSSHWLRNETGLALLCTSHYHPGALAGVGDGSRDGGDYFFRVAAGEEVPMPSSTTALPSRFGMGVDYDGDHGAREAPYAHRRRAPGEGGDGPNVCCDDGAHQPSPSSTDGHRAGAAGQLLAGRRSPDPLGLGPPSRPGSQRLPGSGGGRGMMRQASERRRRPVRSVMIDFEERGPAGGTGVTRWRSLRPIDMDIAGQRLTTMEASSSRTRPTSLVTRSATFSEPRPTRKSLGWAQMADLGPTISRNAGAGAAKVVTEVESRHGVKVLRVRSQVELVNKTAGVCLHVAVLHRAPKQRGGTPRCDGIAGARATRFAWEAVVHPGESCPVPATIATAMVDGRAAIIVRPIVRPSGNAEAKSTTQGAEQGSRGIDELEAGGVAAATASRDFGEAILTLPARTLLERDSRKASYHRILKFAPCASTERRASTNTHAGSRPLFCGVSVERQGARGLSHGLGSNHRRAGLVTVLSFEPTLWLSNLLAAPVGVTLSCAYPSEGELRKDGALAATPSMGASSSEAWSGAIGQGEASSWYQCPPDEEVTMAIRVAGFGWSEAVTLPSSVSLEDEEDETESTLSESRTMHGAKSWDSVTKSPAPRRTQQWRKRVERPAGRRRKRAPVQVSVGLRDAQGVRLEVNAEVTRTTCGLRQVSLWVPFWVVNATSLPLSLEHYLSESSGGYMEAGWRGSGTLTPRRQSLPPAPASTSVHLGGEKKSPLEEDQDRDGTRPSQEGSADGLTRDVFSSHAPATAERRRSPLSPSGPTDAPLLVPPRPPGNGKVVDDRGPEDSIIAEDRRASSGVANHDRSDQKGPASEERREGLVPGGVDWDGFERSKPVMLSHTDLDRQEQRARFRVEDSIWSAPVRLDERASGTALELLGKGSASQGFADETATDRGSRGRQQRAERPVYAIGIDVKPVPHPFHRTKVVALSPRYIIVNATAHAVEVQQAGLSTHVEPLKVASGAESAFHWPQAGARGWLRGAAAKGSRQQRRLILRRSEEGWAWSGQILPDGGGEVTLRMKNRLTSEVAMIRVGTSTEAATVRLVIRNELRSFAPYRIENFSLETLTLRQAGVDVLETLPPYQTCLYSWDEPLGERSLVVEKIVEPATSADGQRGQPGRVVGVQATRRVDARSGEIKLPTRRTGTTGAQAEAASSTFVGVFGLDLMRPSASAGNLRIDMAAKGPTKTLRFTDARSLLPSVPRTHRTRSAYESLPAFSVDVSVGLSGVGLSIVDAYPRELLYLTVGDIALDYIRRGQVDNQLGVTPYPALLYPVAEALLPGPAAVRLEKMPQFRPLPPDRSTCFESILHRDVSYAWVEFVRLASVRVAPVDVNLDMALLDALLEASARVTDLMEIEESPSAGAARHRVHSAETSYGLSSQRVQLQIPAPPLGAGRATSAAGDAIEVGCTPPNKLYVEELAVSPVRIYLSFTSSSEVLEDIRPKLRESAGGGDDGEGGETPDSLGGKIAGALLRAMGTTLSEIENAPIRLKPVVLSHTFSTPQELMQKLVDHYRGQAARQVLSVVGSSKLLGSPLGLLTNLGAGLKDFLYEPAVGLRQSPFGFATGLVKGTSSLVRRTLYSVTDTTDRIVSSISSGILASGAVDVMVRGGSGRLRPYGPLDGLMLGMSGVVREPLNGLRLGGFAGLTTGVLSGWVGLVLRPAYGALMSTSQLCQVVSGYLDPRLDSEQKLRMLRNRPPRFFRSPHQVLTLYSREENVGEELLARVHMGRFRSDGYVWHAAVKDMIFLVTGRRVIMVHGDGGGGSYGPATRRPSYGVVEWEVEFDLLICVEISPVSRDAVGEEARSATAGLLGTGAPARAKRDGGEPETVVTVYHFPDTWASGNDGLDVAGSASRAALRFERRTVVCVDRAQALQICRVLKSKVPNLASAALGDVVTVGHTTSDQPSISSPRQHD